jgi:hypothetical protein
MNWTRSLPLVFGALLLARAAHAAEPTKLACIAANDAGQSLRRAGRLHEAREQLVQCGSASCPQLVRDDCAQRLIEVERVMPGLVFEAKDGAGKAVSSVTVTMDGQRLTDKLDGQSVQVDPGEHQLVFESDGLPRAGRTIVVREGERDRHESVVFEQALTPTTPGASPPGTSPQRTVAFLLGGLGVVGLVVGSAFGVSAISKNGASNANGHCDASGCDPTGFSLRHEALGQATASTVTFLLGLGAAAGGVVVFATAPKDHAESARLELRSTLTPTGGGASLWGTW